ncbi:MAG: hypothetical protein R3C68_19010 [Myxococcota bacterium]
MALWGLIDVHDNGQVQNKEPKRLKFLAELLDSFIEAYWVVADTLNQLKAFPMWRGELVRRALVNGRQGYRRGTAPRPESISRILMNNAFGWMLDNGFVYERPGKRGTRILFCVRLFMHCRDGLVASIALYL